MPLVRREDLAARQEAESVSALQKFLESENRVQLQQATEVARRDGYEQGLMEARAAFAEGIASLTHVDEALDEALAHTVLKLVSACLQRIAGEDTDSESTRHIVRDVVGTSVTAGCSSVIFSHDDAEYVRELFPDSGAVRMELDRTLSAGDIIVVGPLGRRRIGKRDQIKALLRRLASSEDET